MLVETGKRRFVQGAARAGLHDHGGSPAPAWPRQGLTALRWAEMRVLGPWVWGWAGPLRLICALRALRRMEKGYIKEMYIFLGLFWTEFSIVLR